MAAAVTLIVMEPGSEWPGHIGSSESLVVLGSQAEGLCERTRDRLELIRRRGERVRVGVLACNEEVDGKSADQRHAVAREMLAALPRDGFGRLLLSTTDKATLRQRGDILSLAGALSHERATVTVSVRFGGLATATAGRTSAPSLASGRSGPTQKSDYAGPRWRPALVG